MFVVVTYLVLCPSTSRPLNETHYVCLCPSWFQVWVGLGLKTGEISSRAVCNIDGFGIEGPVIPGTKIGDSCRSINEDKNKIRVFH